MDQVPTGWTTATLNDLTQLIVTGRRPKGGVRGISHGILSLGGEHVGINGAVDLSTPRFIPETFARTINAARLQTNDILVVKDGATTGKVALTDARFDKEEAYVNEHVFLCRVAREIEPRLIFAFLRSARGREAILSDFRGAAQGGISRQFSDKVLIPIAPATEQRQIVVKIETLTDKARRARDHLDHIPRLVEKYKQAVLKAAFLGHLTRDWRDKNPAQAAEPLRQSLLRRRTEAEKANKAKPTHFDFSPEEKLPSLPHSWTWMPVAALATKVVDGVHKKPQYVQQGIPFLTVRNLTAGVGITFDGCRFISAEDHSEFIKRTDPEEGDILITKDGTLGVVRAVRTNEVFSIFVSLALVKPIDRTMTDYLELAFTSPVVQQQMTGVGSGLQHIHLNDLRMDMIPVAPAGERKEIVTRLRGALAWIDRIASEATSARRLIDRLDQAVLAKAFRGELVPQDPADEPASVLLDRIRAERGAMPRAKRGRKAKAG